MGPKEQSSMKVEHDMNIFNDQNELENILCKMWAILV